jgi:hypothetical protein
MVVRLRDRPRVLDHAPLVLVWKMG